MSITHNFSHTQRACYIGYITQAIINNFSPLLFVTFVDSFSVTLSDISLLVTANFGIQLLVDLLSTKVVDKIGYRPCVVAAHFFSAAGLVSLSVLPFILKSSYAGLLLSTALNAIGGGLIEVLVSPIVEACPSDKKSSNMSLLHSFYCWGHMLVVILSTLFFVTAGVEKWRILACLWAIVPFVNAFIFMRVPIRTTVPQGEAMPLKKLLCSKVFWVFIVLMICSGASEQAMSQWASAFAEKGLNVSKTMGDLLGPCMFAALMGVSRVFYSKMSEKINLLSFILGSCGVCIASYLLASLSDNPLLGLVGCGMCGLSVGILWPGVFSSGAADIPTGGTAMFALFALAGDLGCGFGPTAVGFISDLNGGNMKTGLLAAAVFPLLLICSGTALKRITKNRITE